MKVLVSKLDHHPLNRKVYILSDIDDLASSIQEVGLLQPLVIDEKNRVISGNRRLVAIQQLGIKTVEVEKVKVSNQEVGKLLVHHNKQKDQNPPRTPERISPPEEILLSGSGTANGPQIKFC